MRRRARTEREGTGGPVRPRAFTLVETLVALAVALLVFGIVLVLLRTVPGQAVKGQEKLDEIGECLALIEYLRADVSQAVRLVVTGDRLTITRLADLSFSDDPVAFVRSPEHAFVEETVVYSLDGEGKAVVRERPGSGSGPAVRRFAAGQVETWAVAVRGEAAVQVELGLLSRETGPEARQARTRVETLFTTRCPLRAPL